ncbi:MAG: AbrB/MazE/SpoVT family DNA-binding domain-containing protein [Candidatus Woesearchaeota archaeon]
MEILVKPRKVGGSLMARIPKDVVDEMSIEEGKPLIMELKKPRRDFFGILKGKKMTPFTEEDRMDARM